MVAIAVERPVTTLTSPDDIEYDLMESEEVMAAQGFVRETAENHDYGNCRRCGYCLWYKADGPDDMRISDDHWLEKCPECPAYYDIERCDGYVRITSVDYVGEAI